MKETKPLTATYGLKHKDGSFAWAGRFKPSKHKEKGFFYWRLCSSVIEGSMNAKLVRVRITEIK